MTLTVLECPAPLRHPVTTTTLQGDDDEKEEEKEDKKDKKEEGEGEEEVSPVPLLHEAALLAEGDGRLHPQVHVLQEEV